MPEPLLPTDKGRWFDLVRFVLTWAFLRRPSGERDQILQAAVDSQEDPARREEVQRMAKTIAEAYIEEGELRGYRKSLLVLLEERFRPLSEALVQRIAVASDRKQLEACILQALKIKSLDEMQL